MREIDENNEISERTGNIAFSDAEDSAVGFALYANAETERVCFRTPPSLCRNQPCLLRDG